MYNWNQFKSFPKFKNMSAQEQARQYFLYQSNMMMEQSAALAPSAAAAAGAGAGGGGSLPTPVEVIPTFAFKSNRNLLRIGFSQAASLEGSLLINWGDGFTETTFINQQSFSSSHTYDKQNEDLVEINITTDLDITVIDLQYQLLTEIVTNELPNSIQRIYLSYNSLSSFISTQPLPSPLLELNLRNNILTSFNPNQPLPSSLEELNLNNNQLTTFNPSFALPSSLQYLLLDNNLLTIFNPTQPLSISMREFSLDYNKLNTAAINTLLILLNTRYTGPGPKWFYLAMSPSAPPSGAGLTAKSSMISKGYNVYTN